jgi:hypothetical protein
MGGGPMIKRTEDHRYVNEETGVEYPSVTKIIGFVWDGGKSDRLIPWAVKQTCEYLLSKVDNCGSLHENDVKMFVEEAKKEATRKKEEAGDTGTFVHNHIEEWSKDPGAFEVAPFEVEDVRVAIAAFLEWAAKVELEPVETEVLVYDETLKYAGTFDMIAWMKVDGMRQLFLLDFKTSNYFYDVSMGAQLAAYNRAYGGKHPIHGTIEGIGVVRLDKTTGKPHFRDYTAKEGRYLDAFLMFRKLYRWFNEEPRANRKPRKKKEKSK